ncbi:MAG: hypothetical protein IJO63_01485 [Bacilli bacterium]|nr:hypothetical protein [Bacilli bacterium]
MKQLINKVYAYFKDNYKLILFNVIFLFGLIVICYYPFPYVVYRPGGLIDLNERIEVEGTKDTIGSYNMTYVTMAKGTLPNILLSFLFDGWDIEKEEGTLYDGNYEENFRLSQLDLQNSVDTAQMVAFKKAGYDVKVNKKQLVVNTVEEVAKTDLQVLDRIEKINGIDCKDIEDVRSYIGTLQYGDKVSFYVETDDGYKERYAVVYKYDNRKVVGITFFEKFEYETDLEVEFKSKGSEAGSSGGLMLTLTIYDRLVDEDLTSGKVIAGTGTINQNGKVGEIGGIKYKMIGANRNGADVYLAPQENCDEATAVYEKYDLDFKLKCVKNFDEAVNYLNSIK